MRAQLIKALLDIFEDDENTVLLTGDLGYNAIEPITDKYPDRFFNVGIAEQNMLGLATGLALSGKTVFVYSIATFNTLRCLEQIRNDAAYHNANVKIIANGGGFNYGSLGYTHHLTEDISVMRSIANVDVYAPCDGQQTYDAIKKMYETTGTSYIRLGREEAKVTPVVGTDIAFFVTGSIYSEVLKATEILKEKNIFASIYTFPVIKPVNMDVLEIVEKYENIVTVEENNLMGGFGSSILEVLNDNGIKKQVTRIGVENKFAEMVGNSEHLRKLNSLDAQGIANRVLEEIL